MLTTKFTADMLDAILRLTRIDNERMRQALHDHLVLGHSRVAAATRHGYKRQQLEVHVKHITTKLKPAFDAYAAALVAATPGQ